MSELTTLSLGPTFFSKWTIPIYYADGRVGHANEEVALGIATGAYRFGAKLSPEDQERFENMARGPRKAKPATSATALLDALSFIGVAADNEATLGMNAKHVRLSGKMAVAYDGQLSAGHPIVEELTLCPQLDPLMKALKRSGKTLTVAETPSGRLSIKGEKLQAYIPCLTPDQMAPIEPDPRCAVVDDRIKAAFKCCGTLASENGTRVVEASLLLRANDCTGTNGAAILQFWHGIDLPPNMVLPKVFCAAVAAVKAPLEGFGMTWNAQLGKPGSVTFYFEGGAWLKTQCYADQWPDTDGLWWSANFGPVPEGLFEGIDTVADFNEKGFVSFFNNAVRSHKSLEIGASYEVKGLQGGKGFQGKLMAQVAPWCAKIDLNTYPDRALFVGGEQATPVRGIVMGLIENTAEVSEPEPAQEPVEPSGTIGGAQMEGDDNGPFAPQATAEHGAMSGQGGATAMSGQPTTTTAQTNVSHSEGGWSAPVSGWSGEIDDDVPYEGQ